MCGSWLIEAADRDALGNLTGLHVLVYYLSFTVIMMEPKETWKVSADFPWVADGVQPNKASQWVRSAFNLILQPKTQQEKPEFNVIIHKSSLLEPQSEWVPPEVQRV